MCVRETACGKSKNGTENVFVNFALSDYLLDFCFVLLRFGFASQIKTVIGETRTKGIFTFSKQRPHKNVLTEPK